MKMANAVEMFSARDLLFHLTLREIRSKYKRSILGWAWSMVNPLATMLIFAMVFRVFLRIQPPVGSPSGLKNFAFFLLCGLLPWNFVSNGLSASVSSLVGNSGLIKKVYFPRSVLPAAAIFSWDVTLLIELGVLTVALLVVGNFVVPWLPLVVLVVVVQTVFVLGLGLGISALNVYFRDVEHFLGIALLMWFYASPIVYPASVVPVSAEVFGIQMPLRTIFELNPMVHFIDAYRSLLYDLRFPDTYSILYMIGAAALTYTLGTLAFNRLQTRFAEEL